MRLLGLDVGTRTIGLAVCDPEGRVATPLRTLRRRGGDADLSAVAEVAHQEQAEGLVLGLPLTMEGEEGPEARRIRRLGDALAGRLELPVHFSDERFSTAVAERVLLDADVSRARRKQVVDHMAAAVILQGYLDAQQARRGAGGER